MKISLYFDTDSESDKKEVLAIAKALNEEGTTKEQLDTYIKKAVVNFLTTQKQKQDKKQ